MYITGIGRTKFGNLSESLPELAYEAIYASIIDSNLSIKDIDCIIVSNFLGGPLNGQLQLNSMVASLLPDIHIPIFRIETACASSSIALNQSIALLHNFNNIMVVGVEKMTSDLMMGPTEAIAMAADKEFDLSNGLIFPASYALIAQQYMRRYGISHDVLERVSYINHKNANLNPFAHFYHKDVTIEMIKNSPMVASPLNLFDCSPLSDGAVSVIVSNQKRSDRAVKILSSNFVTDSISLTQRKDLTSFKAVKIASKNAYKESAVSPRDVDVLEVHDCFTISELIALEDLNFCKSGQASQLICEGYTSRNGELPVNTDGGLKANGHPIGATGLAQIYEVVTQIRGEADERQIDGVEMGMTHNVGGVGGTAAVTILGMV
ncbi:thiolase C-terminal domain-containing protein [Methanobacterium sp.]|uniref:thiolase C-terminal domain-containing protein n=1 Tax=Methanobacterium sp. TaxID=2164 RepID=UPI002ABCA522|nr:thiolase domain-containing protein [Methanobacterium sp.]MDY9922727.1 thiolase domain-containing protein [Methanobacterium sp.]